MQSGMNNKNFELIKKIGFQDFMSKLEKKVLSEIIDPRLNAPQNAKILKMKRMTLVQKLEKYNIKVKKRFFYKYDY